MTEEKVGYKNPPKSTQFKKGDPRINRNGRPKSFDTLRKLAQQIAHEEATSRGQTIIIDNQKQTNITMLMRDLMQSNPVKFLEYAFGKPKEEIDVTSGGEQIKFIFGGANIEDDI